MARRTDINSRAEIGVIVFFFGVLLTSGFLAGNEMVLSKLGAVALTQFTYFFARFHRVAVGKRYAVFKQVFVVSLF